MTGWENPYAEWQTEIRVALKSSLRRSNGRIARRDFDSCLVPGRDSSANKLRLRLLRELPNGELEWKPEITSLETLRKRVGESASASLTKLEDVWQTSQDLKRRAPFPFLAPAGNLSQIVSLRDIRRLPVFSFDMLARPPVHFQSDDGEHVRNSLTLGKEGLVVVIHGNVEEGLLLPDGQYLVRIVVGHDLVIPIVSAAIPALATKCEFAMYGPLRQGDVRAAVECALPHVNAFAEEIAYSFLS